MRFFRQRPADPVTVPLDTGAAAACAALHAASFAHPWDETEFEALLAAVDVAATGTLRHRKLLGFILSRTTGPEAEVLTLAVAAAARRQGIGRGLLDANLLALAKLRVAHVFLEVDEGNAAAVQLYRHAGFVEVGRRQNYYRTAGSGRAHALVMRLTIR